ncbi:unnamed protein product [Caenorhabditis brenneri]
MEGPEVSKKIPSLLLLSALNVGEYLLQGRYDTVDYELSEEASNKVFEVVKEANLYSEQKIEKMHKVLMRMNYLTESIAGPSQKKSRMEKDEPPFDIIALLNDCLKRETRQTLMRLDISIGRQKDLPFSEGWVQSMTHLSSLQSLNLSGNKISNKDFVTICESFPRLTTIDVSQTGISSLTGISNLVVLYDLTIGSDEFKSPNEIEDIFNLKFLKRLVMKEEGLSLENKAGDLILVIDRAIPLLEELVFVSTRLRKDVLLTIVRRNANLKTIVTIGCQVHYDLELTEVEFITDNTLASCLRGLDYFPHMKSIDFDVLKKDLAGPLDYCCKTIAMRFKNSFFKDSDRMLLIENTLRLAKWKRATEEIHGAWENVNSKDFYEMIKMIRDPPVDQITVEAMKYFLLDDAEVLYWLKTIDFFADKVDIKSKYYEEVNTREFVRLFKKCSTIYEDTEYQAFSEKLLKIFRE